MLRHSMYILIFQLIIFFCGFCSAFETITNVSRIISIKCLYSMAMIILVNVLYHDNIHLKNNWGTIFVFI